MGRRVVRHFPAKSDRLEGFASAHQLAMNMDAMSKAGILELVRDGSEFQSYTKKYQLPPNSRYSRKSD